MVSRRLFLQSSATSAACLASGVWPAWAANAPGVTDTEIKIGQTMPYSGPVSAFGTLGRAEAAYFEMVNATGGVNGRRIRLLSLDDGYSPPRTIEQTRKLVESDEVLLLFSSFGTPPNTAAMKYLNAKGVPQLFIAATGMKWGDPRNFPWTMAFLPSQRTGTAGYVQYLLKNRPDAKIDSVFDVFLVKEGAPDQLFVQRVLLLGIAFCLGALFTFFGRRYVGTAN